MRMKNPPHPGGFVKTEIIEDRGLGVTDAAGILGVDRTELAAFLNGLASLSPDLAVRIQKAFGVRMDTLLRMQNSWNLAQARHLESEVTVNGFVPADATGESPA